jgi:hypothetical protein
MATMLLYLQQRITLQILQQIGLLTRRRLRKKQDPAALDSCAKIEELLESAFSTRFVPRGYIMRTLAEQEYGAEVGSNTSTIALRVVGGDEKGTQCLGV